MSQGEMSRPTRDVSEESEKTNAAPTGATEQTRDIEAAAPTQNLQQPLPQPYPQYQAPYAPYPQAPQYAQPVRILPPYNKVWTISKLILSVLSFSWAIIILSLSLAVSVGNDYGSTSGLALFSAPIQVVVIFWNLAELTTFFVRSRGRSKTRRGIHPGAHIGMHLIFWLACVFGIFMTLLILISAMRYTHYCSETEEEDEDSYYRGTSYCDDYSPTSFNITGLRAVLAMWCLAIINHFVLFVLACIDTHQRNRLRPAGIVFAQPSAVPAPYLAPQPQQGVGMVPLAYYPPPPPQQAYMAPAFPGPLGKAPVPEQQNYQNLAGFYAPPQVVQAPSPAAPAPVPTTQPGSSVPSGDEITQAPARA